MKEIKALEKELLGLKKEAEEASQEAAELKGRITEIENTLKKEFGCASILEAEKELGKLDTEIEEMANDISESIRMVKEKYTL